MRARCKWEGCDTAFYSEGFYSREHESIPHVWCTCGKRFSVRGFPAHHAQIERYGKDHPGVPVELWDLVHKARAWWEPAARRREAAQMQWARQENQEEREARALAIPDWVNG